MACDEIDGVKRPVGLDVVLITHRFHQPVGKQYTYSKGIDELSEVERLTLRIKQLEMHNELLGKLNGILRKSPKGKS